jgi:esterase/lipase
MAYSEEEKNSFKKIIINGLSLGESLKSILENNTKLPNRTTVYNWLNPKNEDYDEQFFNNYARAREESADLDAEKIQEIAEKTLKNEYDPRSARVAIDAYKWAAGVKKPKKYGNKIDLTTGGDKIGDLSTEEKEARLKALLEKASK